MFKFYAPTLKNTTMLAGILICSVAVSTNVNARSGDYNAPTLIITSDDLPAGLREKIYSKPARVRSITPREVSKRTYAQPQTTLVTKKVHQLNDDLAGVQRNVETLSSQLQMLQRENEACAADYYANVATINTQLQAGTTRGNPRLVKHLTDAENKLENLASSLVNLNALASQTSGVASEASFLLEETRAAYGISGAIEEDHVRLAEVEDYTNNTLVVIERILNTANDDITRASTYLSSERNNLRTLALAVTNGDLYGKSLANRPFSSAATQYGSAQQAAAAPAYAAAAPQAGALSSPRLLAKIKFDAPNVEYQQPVYAAVNEAMQRYPNARFDLVAVHPTSGNPAQVAIESTKARRNAEKVLRTLTQMGLPLEQIDLSYSESAQASSNEVHLFIK
jgi:hypothetical protein